MKDLRIHLPHVAPAIADLPGNRDQIISLLETDQARAADVVVLPNAAVTGGPLHQLASDGEFLEDTSRAWAAIADHLERGSGDRIVLCPVHPGGYIGVLNEHVLELEPIDVGVSRLDLATVSLLVLDGDAIQLPAGELALDADAIVVCANTPYDRDLHRRVHTQLSALALSTRTPVLYTNRGGSSGGLVYPGVKYAYDVRGNRIAATGEFAGDSLDVTIDRYGTPRSDTPPAAPLSENEAVYRAAVIGLRDYVHACGMNKVILGLSGGIDSALVAAIAADALGGENVIGVSMPSEYSSDHSRSDAKESAELIGLEYREVAIAEMVNEFMKHVPVDGIAAENVQARVRGQILMAFSNQEGPLVLATGNRTEVAVGYSTMYGDSVGGYAPIADIPKTLVWEISKWRNQQADGPKIPENSITKPPSAELRPDQKDSDSLPEYDELDAILALLIDQQLTVSQIIERGFPTDTVARIYQLVRRAQWKRNQFAQTTKISPVTFGLDYQMPPVHHFQPRSTQ